MASKEYHKKYYQENKEVIKERASRWIKDHRESWNNYHRGYRKKMRDADPEYREKELDRLRSYREDNKDLIKERRKLRKAKLRTIIGRFKTIRGCCVCGYRRSSCALDLHHLDPSEKDQAVSKLVNGSMKKIKEELSKCVVICSNCHRELHAGAIELT